MEDLNYLFFYLNYLLNTISITYSNQLAKPQEKSLLV